MGVLLQNDQPVGGISADVIETINFSDLTTTSKTLPGAINELAANPSTTESMSQAEYNALTEAEKMDGTARFVYDAISTDESELWTRVGRNTLHTDAQIISNAINEIKDTMGSGTLTTTSPTIIGGINELNSSLIDVISKMFDIRIGTVSVARQSGRNTAQATFDTPFSGTEYPYVVCFMHTSAPQTFFVSADNVTTAGFQANLYNNGSSASTNALVRYIAIRALV